MAYYEFCISQAFQIVPYILLLMHDRVFSRTIEVCSGVCGNDSFCLQEQERGKFFILMQYAWSEALILQDISSEYIAAG